MRILLASLLTLAALVAASPSGSAAIAVCSSQNDTTDGVLGDDALVTQSCTTENVVAYDCDLVASVGQDGVLTYSLTCPPLYYCVTEPCPNGMGTSGSVDPLARAPCSTVGNPFLDAGFGVQCQVSGNECHAVVATYGTIEDFLSPSVGCTHRLLDPPYDCVQDCDGPPTE